MGKSDQILSTQGPGQPAQAVNYKLGQFLEICITSFLSSVNADLFVYPLDVTKTRLQIQGEYSNPYANIVKYRGLFGTALGIAKEEGFTKLYSGFTALVMRHFFVAGLKIGSYDYIRQKLAARLENNKTTVSILHSMLAGLGSGAISTIASTPLDLIKLQMQMESKRVILGLPPRSTTIIQTIKLLHSQGGVRSFYRGFTPNVIRVSLYSVGGISFYDMSKQVIQQLLKSDDNLLVQFLGSMVAGFTSSALSCPADVVKSRIMNQPFDKDGRPLRYKNSLDCLQTLIKNEGPMAVYKGFMPYWLRCGPWFLVFWMTFESIRRVNGYGTF